MGSDEFNEDELDEDVQAFLGSRTNTRIIALATTLTIATTNFAVGLKTLDYLVNLPQETQNKVLHGRDYWNEQFPFPANNPVRFIMSRPGEEAGYLLYENFYKEFDFKQ